MFGLGVWEVFLILVACLLVFGAKRLPEIGSAFGKSIKSFKKEFSDIEKEIEKED